MYRRGPAEPIVPVTADRFGQSVFLTQIYRAGLGIIVGEDRSLDQKPVLAVGNPGAAGGIESALERLQAAFSCQFPSEGLR